MYELVEQPWLQLMCCMVATSDERKKFEMKISTD